MRINNGEVKCKMPITQIRAIYDERVEKYNKLNQLLTFYLKNQIEKRKIPILEIQNRVKDYSSLIAKINTGGYENPFDEIEDFCGIRIVCIFTNHINELDDIIYDLFHVLKKEGKKDSKKDDQFGYVSDHYIVKLKEEMQSINSFYNDINAFKAEIQVRTILMHAWAEVSHKLVYKEEEIASKPFLRNLNSVAAVLEQQDEQFSAFYTKNSEYRQKLGEINIENQFDINEKFNLENLTSFCALFFKNKPKSSDEDIMRLFEELIRFDEIINYSYIIKSRNVNSQKVIEIENEMGIHNQTGTIKLLLDISNNEYWEYRKRYLTHYLDADKRIPLIEKIRSS